MLLLRVLYVQESILRWTNRLRERASDTREKKPRRPTLRNLLTRTRRLRIEGLLGAWRRGLYHLEVHVLLQ